VTALAALVTTIQKFQELTSVGAKDRRTERGAPPTLSEASNIFVMVDEAHRTQYRALAANLRQALPNACFLGFTGTPIDKKDKSTLRTFGPYIDTYTGPTRSGQQSSSGTPPKRRLRVRRAGSRRSASTSSNTTGSSSRPTASRRRWSP
jgi:hypothetical protein